MKQKREGGRSVWQILAFASTLGMSLFGSILTGVILGRGADYYLGTAPWGLLGFSLLGALAGLWGLYKKAVNKE